MKRIVLIFAIITLAFSESVRLKKRQSFVKSPFENFDERVNMIYYDDKKFSTKLSPDQDTQTMHLI